MIDPLLVTTEELVQIKERMLYLSKIERGKDYAKSRIEFIEKQFKFSDAKKKTKLLRDLKEWINILKHIEEMPSI